MEFIDGEQGRKSEIFRDQENTLPFPHRNPLGPSFTLRKFSRQNNIEIVSGVAK